MKTLNEVIDLYKQIWKYQNKFGKCVLFPILTLGFPIIFIIALGTKKDD